MPVLRVKRGTRAQLDAAATADGLLAGEPYLITDEERLAIGTAIGAYRALLRENEPFIGQPEHVIGNLGATPTIDPANGNRQTATVDQSCTITLATPATATAQILLHLTNAGASHAITWPGTLAWVTGTAPDLDDTDTAENIIALAYINGGWIADGGALQ